MQQQCDKSGPAGLVRGAEPCAGLAVEILVEQQMVAEGGFGPCRNLPAEAGSPPVRGAQEQTCEPPAQFVRDRGQGRVPPGAYRELHQKVVAVVAMKLVERLHEEVIDRHPDRAAPVGIPPEDSRLRFAGDIGHAMPHPAGFEDERLCRVTFRQGAHAVSGEKFRLVQRPPQQRLHAMAAQQREQDAIPLARHFPTRD